MPSKRRTATRRSTASTSRRSTCPRCEACGGLLKPDVVFFGERVPAERVQRAFAALEQADAMLVVGSSLMVYSGYRFAQAHGRSRQADRRRKPRPHARRRPCWR